MLTLSQSRIRQIAIVCQDVPRATAFYRDVLGVPFLFAAGPNLTFFDAGGTRLMLANAEPDVAGTSMLYFLVTGIEETQRALVAKGVTVIREPHMIAKMPDHDLWLAEFRDSEGNGMALMEEKRS